MVAYAVTPGVLALSLGVAVSQMGRGPTIAVSAAVLTGALVIAALERLTPHTPAWVPTWRALRVDALHALVTARLVTPAVQAALLVLLGGSLTEGTWALPALQAAPLAAQVGFAVVLADLGAYVAHRLMHSTGWGWRMHAVHHASTSLNLLASARSHPFNAAFTSGAELAPLLALGAPAPVLAYWSVIKVVNGLLQHCNVVIEPGWLGGVLATAEAHRWHHSVHLAESNTNFGNTTLVWDRLFGTLHQPSDRRPGIAVGIAGADVPEGYLTHLGAPFVLQRYAVEPGDPRA
jgi:sterol desaturase/sphingolipid hydroxylase (fatty acid hydroxylase superfamily)